MKNPFQLILIYLSILFIACPKLIYASENEKPVDSQENAAEEKDKAKYRVVGLPVIMYTPETSLVFGGGATITIRKPGENKESRPSNICLFALYSLKNQFALHLVPDLYFKKGTWELRSLISLQKKSDTFYGIGNDTSEDDAENFTSVDFCLRPWFIRRIYKHFHLGLWFDVKRYDIKDPEEGGMLDQGTVTGTEKGVISGIGPVIDWDSRDNIFYPTTGSWLLFSCAFYRDWLGSDFVYESYTLDLRKYFSLASDRVLALQLLGVIKSGGIPFNELAKLESMRGIFGTRFRDLNMVMAQIEYRYPVSKKFSGTVFTSLGDVIHNAGKYKIEDMKYTVGVGLRYLLDVEEHINIRFDIGISSYGIYPYIQIMEAF